MKKLLIIALLLLASPVWGATNLTNVDFHPSQNWYGGDSTYLYGYTGSAQVVKADASYTVTNGKLFTEINANYAIHAMYTTSTDGLIFVVAYDSTTNKYYLYKSVDGGANFGSNPPAFDDNNYVMMFGDVDGTVPNQIANVRSLGTYSFLDAEIGGSRVLFIGEYNVNASRVNGSTNDQVRLMKSTDSGTTWTEVAHWNTDGTNNNTRHIHQVTQDPYTGDIYIAFGDTDAQSGIIRWDGTSSFASNQNISEYNDDAGFDSAAGDQKYRTAGILFTADKIVWGSDTSTDASKGIYRANRDFTSTERIENTIHTIEPEWAYLAALKLTTGELLLSVIFSSGTYTDAKARIWISDDNGASWNSEHKVGFRKAPDSSAHFLKSFFEWKGKIYATAERFAGTSVGTLVLENAPCNNPEKVLHPVYYVGIGGTDNTTGYGRKRSAPWATINYALEGSRVAKGGVVLIGAGSWNNGNDATIVALDGTLNTTGNTIVRGTSQDSTVWYGGTSAGLYYQDGTASGTVELHDMQLYATTANGASIYSLNSASVEVYDCTIGKVSSGGTYGIRTNGGQFKAVRTRFIMTPAATGETGIFYGAVNNGVGVVHYCIFTGGGYQINYGRTGSTLEVYNSVFYDYATHGIGFVNAGANVPTIKNSIFTGRASTSPIRDYISLTEADAQIDYNSYDAAPVALANSGGSHSLAVGADPKFKDAVSGNFTLLHNSPAINAGVDVSLTTDFINHPVPVRAIPDIGAYEYIPSSRQSFYRFLLGR